MLMKCHEFDLNTFNQTLTNVCKSNTLYALYAEPKLDKVMYSKHGGASQREKKKKVKRSLKPEISYFYWLINKAQYLQ